MRRRVKDSFLANIITVQQQYVAMYEAGLGFDPAEVLASDAAYYLSGTFGRAWFENNKGWIAVGTPRLVEILEEALESTPVQTEFDYLNDVRARIREIQNQTRKSDPR